MTKYREILRLYSHGISKSGIAVSCGCARKTVTKVIDRAKRTGYRMAAKLGNDRRRTAENTFS